MSDIANSMAGRHAASKLQRCGQMCHSPDCHALVTVRAQTLRISAFAHQRATWYPKNKQSDQKSKKIEHRPKNLCNDFWIFLDFPSPKNHDISWYDLLTVKRILCVVRPGSASDIFWLGGGIRCASTYRFSPLGSGQAMSSLQLIIIDSSSARASDPKFSGKCINYIKLPQHIHPSFLLGRTKKIFDTKPAVHPQASKIFGGGIAHFLFAWRIQSSSKSHSQTQGQVQVHLLL